MATYKVLQDIEAEDKLLGPLSMRQFVYAAIAVFLGYISFLLFSKGAGFIGIFFLPLVLAFGFFAWPWGRDQPTEIWALAKIQFLLKPRKKVWDQSGIKDLVTITAPKKVVHSYTNGLSQEEVHSRLSTLANTIDSRGWAIKNVNVNLYAQGYPAIPSSDRLLDTSDVPQEVPSVDVSASDDILDENNNHIAQQFDNMIAASEKAHRDKIMLRMKQSSPPPPPVPQPTPQKQQDFWFMNEPQQSSGIPNGAVTFNTQVVTPQTAAAPATYQQQYTQPVPAPEPSLDEEQVLKELEAHSQKTVPTYSHLHTLQPISEQYTNHKPTASQPSQPPAPTPAPQPQAPPPPIPPQQTQAAVTQRSDADIIDLSQNDDFNVATIAREAQKRRNSVEDEVVISLH